MIMDSPSTSGEILLEITQIGNLLRVAAVDPETLIEVTFQAPPTAGQATLAALARRKLAFARSRRGAVDS